MSYKKLLILHSYSIVAGNLDWHLVFIIRSRLVTPRTNPKVKTHESGQNRSPFLEHPPRFINRARCRASLNSNKQKKSSSKVQSLAKGKSKAMISLE